MPACFVHVVSDPEFVIRGVTRTNAGIFHRSRLVDAKLYQNTPLPPPPQLSLSLSYEHRAVNNNNLKSITICNPPRSDRIGSTLRTVECHWPLISPQSQESQALCQLRRDLVRYEMQKVARPEPRSESTDMTDHAENHREIASEIGEINLESLFSWPVGRLV